MPGVEKIQKTNGKNMFSSIYPPLSANGVVVPQNILFLNLRWYHPPKKNIPKDQRVQNNKWGIILNKFFLIMLGYNNLTFSSKKLPGKNAKYFQK